MSELEGPGEFLHAGDQSILRDHHRDVLLTTTRRHTLLEGKLSPRALGLVTEWALSHQGELMENWRLARAQAP